MLAPHIVGRTYHNFRGNKIYLENGNLMHAIAEDMNAGTLRELFFVNQLRNAFSNQPALGDATVELTDRGGLLGKVGLYL